MVSFPRIVAERFFSEGDEALLTTGSLGGIRRKPFGGRFIFGVLEFISFRFGDDIIVSEGGG
jgi:hypothetical protein